jgi:two-component system, sporulation sensor kinase E
MDESIIAKELTEEIPPSGDEYEYCPWEEEEVELLVGIVGTGPGFLTILDIIFDVQYHDFLPTMRLLGVAEPGPHRDKVEQVRKRGVPVYGSWEELLEAHPEINVLIELKGSRYKLKRLRSSLPDSVSLIDHNSAIFLCGMHNMYQVGTHCQVNLDRHKLLLQSIIDRVGDDIILLDKECRVMDLNRNVVKRSGKAKEELLGKFCWEVQSLDDGTTFCAGPERSCPLFRSISTREYAEGMLTRVDENGRLHYFRIYSYPILDETGSMSHILVMRRDITSRTQREKHEQQSERLSVIGEMSMYLAHEIRNPLFAIGGFTNSLLNSPNIEEKERDKLKIIAEEAKRLDAMLTSILNFAAPMETVKDKVDVVSLVEDVVELMRIGYSQRGYTFITDVQPDLPKVHGEVEKIKQCLINIVKNSIEAMDQGGPVLIRARLNKDFVMIQVEDRGLGMSEKQLQRAFSPFFTTKTKGYGLGLSMIKKIIEEYGGHVEITSKEGKGTTVTLFIPPVLAGDDETPDDPSAQPFQEKPVS